MQLSMLNDKHFGYSNMCVCVFLNNAFNNKIEQ